MQCGDGKENCKNEKLKKKWIRSFSENIDLEWNETAISLISLIAKRGK